MIPSYQTSADLPHSVLFSLPHPTATRCSFHAKSTVQRFFKSSKLAGFPLSFFVCGTKWRNIIGRLDGCMDTISCLSNCGKKIIQPFWTAILTQSVLICNQISDARISIWMALLAMFKEKVSMDSVGQRKRVSYAFGVRYAMISFLALAHGSWVILTPLHLHILICKKKVLKPMPQSHTRD